MVEYQIDIKVVTVEGDPLLAGHEGKSLTQLQQESLQVIDQGLFQIGLYELGGSGQTEEFHDDRVLENIAGGLDLLSLGGQL